MISKDDGDEAGGEVLQVFIRVRPPISKELKIEKAVTVSGGQTITVKSEKYDINCKYDKIFDDTSVQSDVFDSVKPLLSSVLNGYNACIFAYGQTSAGKSHTMLGPGGGTKSSKTTDKAEWGLIPRAVEFIFSEMYKAADDGYLSYKVKASFVQIYNENLYDLLKDPRESTVAKDDKSASSSFGKVANDGGLKIREIPKPGMKNVAQQYEVYISGLSEFRVQTEEDVMQLLEVGMRNRSTKTTDYNDTSSRSHAILQISFELEKQSESGQTMLIRSKLSFADLAGSEKMSASNEVSEAKHIRELTAINQSLSTLGNVIAALSSNKGHIPYRDSKLTRILQDSLGGNTRTIVIACIAPTQLHAAETMSTLQFADRAKSVMLRVRANTVTDDKDLLIKAYAEIARLKVLLRQALKNNGVGALGVGTPGQGQGLLENGQRGTTPNDGSGAGAGGNNEAQASYQRGRSGSISYGQVPRASSESQKSVTMSSSLNLGCSSLDAFDKNTELNNAITLQIFEENEKLKGENLKMRQALEWSIKLAMKKKSESVEFDTASANEILAYRQILNSIDTTPPTPSLSMGNSMRRGSSQQNLPTGDENAHHHHSRSRTPSDGRRKSSIGIGIGMPTTPGGSLNLGASLKKKSREKSASLPQLFRSQKELDYLEYLSSAGRQGQGQPRTPETAVKCDETKAPVGTKGGTMASLSIDTDKFDIYAHAQTDSDSEGGEGDHPVHTHRDSTPNTQRESSLPAIPTGRAHPADRPVSPSNRGTDTTPRGTGGGGGGVPPLGRSDSAGPGGRGHSPAPLPLAMIDPAHKLKLLSMSPSTSSMATANGTASADSLPQMLAPDLTYTPDDVGMVIEMFSFRYDCWGSMTLTDFDPARGVHKCRLSDGTIQWLDLKKKPIRAVPTGTANE